jgi:SM-20-related protein
MSEIEIYENVLPQNDQTILYNFLVGPGWGFGAHSSPETKHFRYWYKHFGGHFGAREDSHPATFEASLPPVVSSFWSLKQQQLEVTRCFAVMPTVIRMAPRAASTPTS